MTVTDVTHPTIERCLIIDTETNHLSPEHGERVEIGAIMFSMRSASILTCFSTVLPTRDGNVLAHINHVPEDATREIGEIALRTAYVETVWELLSVLIAQSDVVVAHNAQFDKPWWNGAILKRPWVCTLEDFAWARAVKERSSLLHLAADYEIPIGVTHRALPDCMLIAALFARHTPVDLQTMFRHAMRPKGRFMAVDDNGGRFPFMRKDEAKERGFVWEADDAPAKSWSRWMAIDDARHLPFRVVRIDE